MQVLTKEQITLYKKLTTPAKIQDLLDTLRFNFEEGGETCMSPKRVLETGKAHCMEGAMLAASILRFHGHKPLVLDLRAKRPDDDHILALCKYGNFWGAITKTNHAVLRYREPIYRNLRELAMSFFHEYFDNNTGRKNLREYSVAIDLSRFDKVGWETTDKDLWEIPAYIDTAKHYWLITKEQEKNLRPADKIERKAGEVVQWKREGVK